jgi:hypothetical protein
VKTVQLSIAEDSKLSDIVASLDDPIEYVRNVLNALSKQGAKNNPDVGSDCRYKMVTPRPIIRLSK